MLIVHSSSYVTTTRLHMIPSCRWLLPFHRSVLRQLVPPDEEDNDALIVMSPGLGIRRVLSTLLRVFSSPNNLVLILNATPQDVEGLSNDLGTLGLSHGSINQIHHELGARQRCVSANRRQIYSAGGILSVTSRILIVDMLSNTVPTDSITGIVILRAERYVVHLTECRLRPRKLSLCVYTARKIKSVHS